MYHDDAASVTEVVQSFVFVGEAIPEPPHLYKCGGSDMGKVSCPEIVPERMPLFWYNSDLTKRE